jgi:radical SAM family uncharacterized protein/radical SAM-linked protein
VPPTRGAKKLRENAANLAFSCYAAGPMSSTGSALPFASHPYADFLAAVEKPARYTGGEVGSRRKDWHDPALEARVCLAFPDIYDIGMSHLGFKILYGILNDDPRTLAERTYAPWPDMERELRARGLPLVSHENYRPLRDFDVVGMSLQFELTYTNCLNLLDLGGIPLRSKDRTEDCPLILGGGPTATHPEPVAPFFDALVIGDGESACTEVALTWVRAKKAGKNRQERLLAIAQIQGVYVPSLYEVAPDPDTGVLVVDRPNVPGLPARITRTTVELKDYPFPSESPIGGPEAVFDRMSIEIARGCTEGCRFCQAGNIYRPVRERDPEEIVKTVVDAVRKSGQDEVSLTSLSTADTSCISPLIKRVVAELSPERVSLGVSSLRAYGLEEDLLDEMRQVRATGLTFAPEAGTQRMRDVINKNVTEEQLLETAERVFRKGWDRMKLYFMIGLPTEEDDDVKGIVETGKRALDEGKRAMRKMRESAEKGAMLSNRAASVTVSVSTHVPKPHTPFQWCAMDTLDEVRRKQNILYATAKGSRIDLKTHEAKESVLEGVFARGDRSLADVLETAFRNGARFDSWEEHIKHDVWNAALAEHGVDPARFLGTIPVSARLPWDHIDVGLEDGFLLKEYRKALKSRLSPPCGKAVGQFIHHTHLEAAKADERRLVCYDCGVACDMSTMRDERFTFLEKLGAVSPPVPREKRLPIAGQTRVDVVPGRAPSPVKKVVYRYRVGFQKLGPTAFLGHLDLVRAVPRVLRRIEIPMAYSEGFHPKPEMVFAPALSLGVPSLDEYVDLKFLSAPEPAALVEAMNKVAPEGLVFTGAAALSNQDPAISKMVSGARYALAFARSALPAGEEGLRARVAEILALAPDDEAGTVVRVIERIRKKVSVRTFLRSLVVGDTEAIAGVARAGLVGDLVVVHVELAVTGQGTAKASEVAELLCGPDGSFRAVRLALLTADGLSPLAATGRTHAPARAATAEPVVGAGPES